MTLEDQIRAIVREELAAVAPAKPAVTRTPTVELLTEAECAALLKVSRDCLQAWRAANEGPPYVRVGSRAIRYSKPDVISWLASGSR